MGYLAQKHQSIKMLQVKATSQLHPLIKISFKQLCVKPERNWRSRQSQRKAKVRRGRGTATAKGFALLVKNTVGNPSTPFHKKIKNRGFQKKGESVGKKRLVNKEDKNGFWRKKGCCRQEKAVVR